eukprot:1140216-Pelagomonas_calceolata.AAC.1
MVVKIASKAQGKLRHGCYCTRGCTHSACAGIQEPRMIDGCQNCIQGPRQATPRVLLHQRLHAFCMRRHSETTQGVGDAW